jgi:hypothetical protein
MGFPVKPIKGDTAYSTRLTKASKTVFKEHPVVARSGRSSADLDGFYVPYKVTGPALMAPLALISRFWGGFYGNRPQ